MDLIAAGYSYSRIIHDYYVRNWKDDAGSSKLLIARRAVLAYHADNAIQANIDPAFKIPDDPNDYDKAAQKWAHQIDKFFSASETVKLPYSFGDYLVLAMDDRYRKRCQVELDRKRRTLVGDRPPAEGNVLDTLQSTIKETSEAVFHLVALAPNGLGDDSDQALLLGRQELLEAITAMQRSLAQLDYELSRRDIEILS